MKNCTEYIPMTVLLEFCQEQAEMAMKTRKSSCSEFHGKNPETMAAMLAASRHFEEEYCRWEFDIPEMLRKMADQGTEMPRGANCGSCSNRVCRCKNCYNSRKQDGKLFCPSYMKNCEDVETCTMHWEQKSDRDEVKFTKRQVLAMLEHDVKTHPSDSLEQRLELLKETPQQTFKVVEVDSIRDADKGVGWLEDNIKEWKSIFANMV